MPPESAMRRAASTQRRPPALEARSPTRRRRRKVGADHDGRARRSTRPACRQLLRKGRENGRGRGAAAAAGAAGAHPRFARRSSRTWSRCSSRHGIAMRDWQPPATLRKVEPRRARRSPSTRAIAPTTRFACTCARWARSRCSRARARSRSPSASRQGEEDEFRAILKSPIVGPSGCSTIGDDSARASCDAKDALPGARRGRDRRARGARTSVLGCAGPAAPRAERRRQAPARARESAHQQARRASGSRRSSTSIRKRNAERVRDTGLLKDFISELADEIRRLHRRRSTTSTQIIRAHAARRSGSRARSS